jgi:hypothetical protein
MSRRDFKIVLGEIVDTIDQITGALEGKSFEAFSSDWLLRPALRQAAMRVAQREAS